MLVSEGRLDNLPPPPMLFLCLKFSSHTGLLAFKWLSLSPTVVAHLRAFSLIAASVNARPFFLEFRTQLESARSKSGSLPFALFNGEALRSSGKRNLSFWRRTLETVLAQG